jgi:chaperonin cofactor prefoldin
MESIMRDLDGNPEAMTALERLKDVVTEQIETSADTLEDWEDLVPEEVAKLKEKLSALQSSHSNR